MQTPAPVYFKVFGLQRSGTNLMRALISQNFQAQYLQERDTGWKHGPLRLPGGMWNGSPVGFVLCVKNPYAWAWSCYRFFQNSIGGDPTMAPQFQRDPSMSFEEFLITPSYAFESPIHRWNQMHRLWLATLPAGRTLLVRQEDQLIDQLPILQEAQSKLALRRKAPRLRVINQRVDVDVALLGAMNREYYLDQQYMENYSPCLLERVNRVLDRELMQQFKYELEQWCIEQRQIGPLRLFVRPCTTDATEAWQVAADPYRLTQIKERGESIRTIADIGAGIGAWALLARTFWPQARLLAAESSPDCLRLLRLNTRGLPEVNVLAADMHESTILSLNRWATEENGPHLLRIARPQAVTPLIRSLHETGLLGRINWICARLADSSQAKALAGPLGSHEIQVASTPEGEFLIATLRKQAV